MPALKLRRLGRSGLMVTELGLGAMDTPNSPAAAETLGAALDLGVNFIDTAREYAGSEFLIGQALRERDGAAVQIGSKTFRRTADGCQRDIDRSLSTLGVQLIDLYQLHDVSSEEAWREVMGESGALGGLRLAQERGLIGFTGVSSHSLELVERAITCEEFDTVMVEYSAFFTESRRLIELAAARDVGVIVMRPLGGSGRMSVLRGRIAGGYDGILTPANLLRYVFSQPGISVAIPGARYPARIEENVAAASAYEPMDAAEQRAIEAEAARLYA